MTNFALNLYTKYAARTALTLFAALASVMSLRTLAVGDDSSEFAFLADAAPPAQKQLVQLLLRIAQDISLPFSAFLVYVGVRGSRNLLNATLAAMAWSLAIDLKFVAAVGAVDPERAHQDSVRLLFALAVFAFLFVTSNGVKRVQRRSVLERRVLHSLGYLGMLNYFLPSVLPANSLPSFLPADASPAAVAANAFLYAFLHWEAALTLAVVHYANEEEAAAFYFAAFARLLFVGITTTMVLDWAPSYNATFAASCVVVGAIYIYFVVKRVRFDAKKRD